MNKAILLGRLTADPQTGTTNSGKTFARFTIAIDRIGEGADFINVVAWERQAENVGRYLNKGRQVAVVGHIQTGSYERDGVKRNTFDVIAENVEFVGNAQNNSDIPEDDDFPF